MSKATIQETVKVTLAKPHTHDGKPRAAGEVIQVTAPVRDWLAERQIIKATAPKENAK